MVLIFKFVFVNQQQDSGHDRDSKDLLKEIKVVTVSVINPYKKSFKLCRTMNLKLFVREQMFLFFQEYPQKLCAYVT